ncbi:MAG: S9 family peptidase [Ignavibacteria bacterium]|nr:S9 family peptidase [Ignavibacteria bacterium]
MRNTLFLLLIVAGMCYGQKRAMLVEDMWLMERLESAALSPDGSQIVFAATTYSMDLNKGNTDIYIMNSDGSNVKKIVASEVKETAPQFTKDGKKISYLAGGQVWTCNTDGSNQQKLTDIYSEVDQYVWSPDGKYLLFSSAVYPDCSGDECNKERDTRKESSKVKASIFTELMYRHWNAWRGEKRSHLFLFDIAGKTYKDVNLFSKADVPPLATGSANDFSFSPDGLEIAYSMNPEKVIATSTNNEIYTVKVADITGGAAAPATRISVSKGADVQPVYSPDGKYLAFCSMERAGYEADRQRLMIYDRKTGKTIDYTVGFDRSVGELIWSPDSKSIYFVCSNEIFETLYKVDLTTRKIETVIKEDDHSNLMISPDGKKLYFRIQRTNLPYELFSYSLTEKKLDQLTTLNKQRLDKLEMCATETFWCKGAEGTPVQSLLIKPPFFDANKKYPLLVLIHGGPQGHWSDDFHYRWNVQMFAALGYVVIAPNPRGSTGYGQKFTDQINGDWGGKPYVDIMNATDYALKNFKFLDKNNTFAAGASYGGYMIDWIAGHSNRFNALVSHDGVFNLESMFGTTEELWFPIWENKGTPWSNPQSYAKFSPNKFIKNCKTPMLIVQGANDFRVCEEQAMQLFTSLQCLGVESKFLYFPDETHFVVKPQNAKLWWNTVAEWFAKHRK